MSNVRESSLRPSMSGTFVVDFSEGLSYSAGSVSSKRLRTIKITKLSVTLPVYKSFPTSDRTLVLAPFSGVSTSCSHPGDRPTRFGGPHRWLCGWGSDPASPHVGPVPERQPGRLRVLQQFEVCCRGPRQEGRTCPRRGASFSSSRVRLVAKKVVRARQGVRIGRSAFCI